jgi:phenylpropionate dioxygenase-like ring-hydroxylating dioxygenase large terminal subunit
VPTRVGHAPAGRRLARFPCREEDGLVWVWGGDPAVIDRDPFPIPYRNDDEWTSYYMVTEIANSVTNCVENFMDVPHTVSVHRGWFRSPARRKISATVERTTDSVLVTYDQPADSIGFSARVLNPRGEPVLHTDRFYLPGVTRVDYHFGGRRSFVITSQCTPVDALVTRVYTAIGVRLGRVMNALARLWLPAYTRRVIDQDVEILERQGRSIARYGERFQNHTADVIHHHIEALRAWAAAPSIAAPPPRRDVIDFFV